MTTPLHDLIATQIRADGPMPVAEYMALCLSHPTYGYYTARDPLGADGDFTTAPEISQMFGELVGLWLAQAWLGQGRPEPFVLAELGPGRGTLMRDALRATARIPGFHAAARLRLVEISPVLRAKQAETLANAGVAPLWVDDVAALPEDAPLYLIANEFFDALPIRQLQRDGGVWRERVVGMRDGRLMMGLAPPSPAASASAPSQRHHVAQASDGAVLELCPAAETIAAAIGARLANRGANHGANHGANRGAVRPAGAALIIDYGYESPPDAPAYGDTLQALYRRAYADPLENPGEQDLTAHVNFTRLAAALRSGGAETGAVATQADFLYAMGIEDRARALADANPDQREAVAAALRRLTDVNQMGALFKGIAAVAPVQP